MGWNIKNIPDQTGKTCIVTGANSGIGLVEARVLAEKGAKVILACRDMEKANSAVESIRSAVPRADVSASQLDLASFVSVREFATRFSGEHDRLDLLINNAGVMIPPEKTFTEDGFELHFGTNHLAHFLLTGLLLPLLGKAPAARVVTLSSIVYRTARIDFDNLNAEREYARGGGPAYMQSKLVCLMYALELQRRLEKNGSSIISVAAHPGFTLSKLTRNTPISHFILWLGAAQRPDSGAMPILRAATDSEVRGGDFYGPAWLKTTRGPAVKETILPHALDTVAAKRLWTISEQLTGITYP